MRLFRHFAGPALGILALLPVTRAQTDVLILEPTVTGGLASIEAVNIAGNGLNPVIVSAADWANLTAADFMAARGICLGDPTCIGPNGGATMAPATANAALWGPLIDGNVIVVGTDPTFHSTFGPGGAQGGDEAIAAFIDFAFAETDKTGAYITLSCYYHDTAPGTNVDVLNNAFGGPGDFTVTGVGCFNNINIVATHPAIDPLTNADLENWSCSVHEAFETWPSVGLNPFVVLAIAEIAGGPFTAPDGSVGYPYIIARGEDLTVISDITLAPETTSDIPVGVLKTLTATVTEDGNPVGAGVDVDFEVIAGPCAGETGSDMTDVNGQAFFTYTCLSPGVDTVVARFTDSGGVRQTSNNATCEWVQIGDNYCGPGNPNSTGSPGGITATGSLVAADEDLTLTAYNLPPGNVCLFIASMNQGFIQPPRSCGNLCLMGPDIARFKYDAAVVDENGECSLTIDPWVVLTNPPQPILAGQTWYFQAWHRDAGAGPDCNNNFTDAVCITFL